MTTLGKLFLPSTSSACCFAWGCTSKGVWCLRVVTVGALGVWCMIIIGVGVGVGIVVGVGVIVGCMIVVGVGCWE